MRPLPILMTVLALALPAAGQDVAAMSDPAGETLSDAPGLGPFDAADQSLEQFLWQSRVVVVFADTPRDPAFTRQIELLLARPADLEERDVVILTDTDPAAASPVRRKLRPRGFALVVLDKDGEVMLRKPSPWDLRELTRAIDKTPLRQQELRDARDAEAAERGFPR